jgi:hypothetical protein
MKLKLLWERYRAQHRMLIEARSGPVESTRPKPFQPLTHDQSIAILEDAVQWLIDEAKASAAVPNGPSKDRRRAELRGRHESMAREFARLLRKQKG